MANDLLKQFMADAKAVQKERREAAVKEANKNVSKPKVERKKQQQNKKATGVGAKTSTVAPETQKAAKDIAKKQEKKLPTKRNGSGKANTQKKETAKKTLEALKEASKPTVKTADNYDSNPYTKEKTDAMWNRMATGNTASDKFGRVYAGIGQGVIDATLAVPNLIGKLATGKDVNLQERTGLNIDNDALKETAGFKRGKFAGEMIGYGMQNVAAAPAINGILANTKIGQMAAKSGTKMATNTRIGKLVGEEAAKDFTTGMARNAVEAGTVGLAQNIGIANQEGRTGLDLVGNVLLNTVADLTFGGLMEGAGLGVNAVKGARALHKATGEIADGVQTKTLPTGEEVPVNAEKVTVKAAEPVTEVAEEVIPNEPPKAETQLKGTGGRTLKPNGADVNREEVVYRTSDSIANKKIDNEYMYEATTHEKRNRAADERLAVDYEGEIDDLLKKDHYTDEDFATVKKAFDAETLAGNEDKARRMMRKAAEHSHEKGQELEAVKHLKENTPAGKVYKAQQEAVRAENKMKKSNPKLFEKVNTETKEIDNVIKTAEKTSSNKKEFTENVKTGMDELLKKKGVKNTSKVPLRQQVLEMVERMDYDSEQIGDLLDDVNDLVKRKNGIATLTSEQAHEIVELMKMAENATDDYQRRRFIAEADQIIADIEDATWHEKFRSIQRISLLSNPKTLFTRNAGGNLLLMAAENIKNIPASAFDELVSLKTGQRTTTLTGGFGSQLKGLKKGVVEQAKDIKYGVDTSPSRSQYELPNKTIWDVNKANNKFTRLGTSVMNVMDNVISKSLQFGDRPFYEAAYHGRKAELEKLVKNGKAKLTPEEIEESAKLFALDRTFQGDTWLAQRAKAIKKPLGIVGDLIMPFTQTPANILDKLLDYTPVGLGRALRELCKTSKGTFDQKHFVDVLGRTFTGAGAILLGYSLSKKGLMTSNIYSETGGGEEYYARNYAGEQDYSLKLGDTYISVNWADPVGSLLMIGADFEKGMGDEAELINALYGSTKAAVNGVFDRSFMSGITNLLGGQGTIADKLVDGAIEQTSQLTPNIGVAITKIIDPVKRETYDANPLKKQANVLKSRIPGLSKTLPEKKDITGETVYQYQGRSTKDRALEALLLPYNKTTVKEHDVNDYLMKVYKETGDRNVLLDTADKKFEYDGKTYKIENAQQLSRFQEVQGKAAVNAIRELIKTSDYKNMSKSEQASALSSAVKSAKEKAREDFLINSGAFTPEEYAYTTLSDSHKALVDNGVVSAQKLKGLKDNIHTHGINGNASSVAQALAMDGESLETMQAYNKDISEKHYQNSQYLKALGYTPASYEAEKAKIYDNYDFDNNDKLKQEELDVYFNDMGYSRQQKNALYRAITGKDRNPY